MLRRFWRANSLSVVLFLLFLGAFTGQFFAGHADYNADRKERGQPLVPIAAYVTSGHFVEATFENWESEFLQMGAYVLLTIGLRQKGSPDSKKLDGPEDVDKPGEDKGRGTARQWLYEHSLSVALLSLFAVSFLLHASGGRVEYNEQQAAHGEAPVSLAAFLVTSHFWFQSFQNWRSEFLSIGVLVVFSIFLRQKGSPESKPVDAPNDQTGDG